MERQHVSRASIEIAASSAEVWEALVNPATAKTYFFGADVHSDWTEGSAITFTGAFNGKTYREKGTILQCQPRKLLSTATGATWSSCRTFQSTTGFGPSASTLSGLLSCR